MLRCRTPRQMYSKQLLYVATALAVLRHSIALHPHHNNTAGVALHPHHLVRQDTKARRKDEADAAVQQDMNSSGAANQKIPSLLHYIYLPGYDALVEESSKPDTRLTKEHYDFCQSVHRHWDSMFWDEPMALELIKEHYAWFLPVWEGYDMEAKRSDALRVFIMHHYGGLFLDLDVECYRAADDSFQQYDVVLQGTGDEGINNAVMASMPGHKLWPAYAKVLEERSTQGMNTATKAPMFMTGTIALTKALFGVLDPTTRPISGYLGGEFKAEGTVVKIYPIGEWFVPCYGMDVICIKRFEREKEAGTWDMSSLYGRHYFSESADKSKIEAGLQPHNVTR